ncbi:hypothetical protein [Leptospira noguchii]|uniref:Uncharacterized protein n=1 Tax=Leptospira noguchii str. 2007001578 TaxID=1049974 RepID=A0ABP2TAW9_9LEPT|nr:hypothetical protein [Leptospira noguchii]EMN01427.1 hypothetical protein LEP1GSC035_4120 [Leptospira noguchii str. 2007001578]EMS83734.1 hypothetical protein LEP1GSC073_0031 [Leptospira noguchii str. Cascata]EPE83964.1 hypothetical protein LEP1GSC021_4098 [Leptospira noguchii str. 1993005606]
MQKRVPNGPYLEDVFAGKIWLIDSIRIEFTVAGQRGNYTQLPP